jgi:molybdopterin converting factor small subunit
MEITVKLFGELKHSVPGDRNNFTLKLIPGTSLVHIYKILSIPEGEHVALINGRRSDPDAKLANGDTLVLMPPISGG